MNPSEEKIKQFAHLRRAPGPKPTWLAQAAADLDYSKGYLSRVNRDPSLSPAVQAALRDWKMKNLPASSGKTRARKVS